MLVKWQFLCIFKDINFLQDGLQDYDLNKKDWDIWYIFPEAVIFMTDIRSGIQLPRGARLCD